MPTQPERRPLVFGDVPELRTNESLSEASGDQRGTHDYAMALSQIDEMCLTLQRAVGIDLRLTVDPKSVLAMLTDGWEGDDGAVDCEVSHLEYLLNARTQLRTDRRVRYHSGGQHVDDMLEPTLITGPEIPPHSSEADRFLDSDSASARGLQELAAQLTVEIADGTFALVERFARQGRPPQRTG